MIEPGSFLEPKIVDGTGLGSSDVSNPIVLDESFLYEDIAIVDAVFDLST